MAFSAHFVFNAVKRLSIGRLLLRLLDGFSGQIIWLCHANGFLAVLLACLDSRIAKADREAGRGELRIAEDRAHSALKSILVGTVDIRSGGSRRSEGAPMTSGLPR